MCTSLVITNKKSANCQPQYYEYIHFLCQILISLFSFLCTLFIFGFSLLTMVQPNCGPRSLKYIVAVVPTGRFCKTSSSLSDFSSKKDEEKKALANIGFPNSTKYAIQWKSLSLD